MSRAVEKVGGQPTNRIATSAENANRSTTRRNPGEDVRIPARRSTLKPRVSRELTLQTAAREYVWLYDYRHGMSLGEIALRDRIGLKRVEFGVERARAQENRTPRDGVSDVATSSVSGLRLVPLFPIGHYTPLSACPHREPIEAGSFLCCMVCHKSGLDQHPALQRDARTEPSPESQPRTDPPAQDPKPAQTETRKQKRNRQFNLDIL